jgi:predicted DNA-binding protein (UPF0251 family)
MRKRIIRNTIHSEWGGVEEATDKSSLSRTSLYRLLDNAQGEIEHALVCGRRLINLKSLSAYLSKMSREQAAAKM